MRLGPGRRTPGAAPTGNRSAGAARGAGPAPGRAGQAQRDHAERRPHASTSSAGRRGRRRRAPADRGEQQVGRATTRLDSSGAMAGPANRRGPAHAREHDADPVQHHLGAKTSRSGRPDPPRAAAVAKGQSRDGLGSTAIAMASGEDQQRPAQQRRRRPPDRSRSPWRSPRRAWGPRGWPALRRRRPRRRCWARCSRPGRCHRCCRRRRCW